MEYMTCGDDPQALLRLLLEQVADVCTAAETAVFQKLVTESSAQLLSEAKEAGHATAVQLQSEALLASITDNKEFRLCITPQQPPDSAYPTQRQHLSACALASLDKQRDLFQSRQRLEDAHRDSARAFIEAYSATLAEMSFHIVEGMAMFKPTLENDGKLIHYAAQRCTFRDSETMGAPAQAQRPAARAVVEPKGLPLVEVPAIVKREMSPADFDASHDYDAEITLADIFEQGKASRRTQEEHGWRLAHSLSLGIEPGVTPASNEAAIAARLRQAAEWAEISTELLPEEVSAIFAEVGRCQSFSWMTFHRNPYCWHGLMN